MVWAGRALKGHLVHPCCHGQGQFQPLHGRGETLPSPLSQRLEKSSLESFHLVTSEEFCVWKEADAQTRCHSRAGPDRRGQDLFKNIFSI